MKKIFSVLLVTTLLLSMSVPVFAENITSNGGSQSVTVSYGMAQGFTVTIPAEIRLDENGEGQLRIEASNVMIPFGETLQVSVSSENFDSENGTGWYLIDSQDSENKLEYWMENSDGEFGPGVALEVNAGEIPTGSKSETLYIYAGTITKAGTYQDTLTFTVSVNSDDMITFNVGGRTFYANEGDTWLDFITSDANTTFTCDPPIDDGPHEVYLFQMYSNFIVANFLVDSCPEHAEAFGLENIPFIVNEEDGALLGINDEIIDGAYYVLEGAA